MAVAVHVTGLPTVPVAGQVMTGLTATALITTVVDAVAVFAFESVIVTLTVKVPAALYIVENVAAVPDDGVPPVAVQAKLYGVVPPVPVAVKVRDAPVFPVVGPEIVTESVSALMVIVADIVAVFAFASVTVTETVYEPLTLYIVDSVAALPLAGAPPVAVHANV